MRFFLFLFLASCTGPAQQTPPLETPDVPVHRIDLEWEACHADTANHTTLGMIECESAALDAWKQEMHLHYQALMDSLDPEQKDLLKKSQEAWEQYFHAEAEFSTRFYLDMEGTMWHIYIVSRQREIYRQRALTLSEYGGNHFPESYCLNLNLNLNLSLNLNLK